MRKEFTRLIVAILVIFGLTFLILISCGGGGGGGTTSGGTNSYIGFTTADFSEKTIYYVDGVEYSKAIFHQNGSLQAYDPNQNDWYQEGTWSVTDGKLVLIRLYIDPKTNKEIPAGQTIFTLLNDETAERYFKVSRLAEDGEVNIAGMFYDQVTGFIQAQNFVANHRQP